MAVKKKISIKWHNDVYSVLKKYYSIDDEGNVFSLRTGKVLRPTTIYNRNGTPYLKYRLYVNGVVVRVYAQRFVAYCTNPIANPKRFEADHINRNTLDNRPCNIRWTTKSENSFNRVYVNR